LKTCLASGEDIQGPMPSLKTIKTFNLILATQVRGSRPFDGFERFLAEIDSTPAGRQLTAV
jgi:hypothetical protein